MLLFLLSVVLSLASHVVAQEQYCSLDPVSAEAAFQPGWDPSSQATLWKWFNPTGSCTGGNGLMQGVGAAVSEEMFLGQESKQYKTSPGVKSCPNDTTSLTLDLSRMNEGKDRLDCPGYEIPDCRFTLEQVESITASISMEDCERTWACPFWISPETWVHRFLDLAGEMDLVEVVGPPFPKVE